VKYSALDYLNTLLANYLKDCYSREGRDEKARNEGILNNMKNILSEREELFNKNKHFNVKRLKIYDQQRNRLHSIKPGRAHRFNIPEAITDLEKIKEMRFRLQYSTRRCNERVRESIKQYSDTIDTF